MDDLKFDPPIKDSSVSHPHCGSKRQVNCEEVQCDRRFNHSPAQRHRATMNDSTLILWEGDDSGNIPPQRMP